MSDTVVSDAVRAPQDEGVGSIPDGNEDWGSAGLQSLLAEAMGSDSYVGAGLEFSNHDGANDTVDVTAGVAYLSLASVTVDVQSGLGGSIPPSYDTTLPDSGPVCVVLPTATTVPLQDSTDSDVWVAYATDGSVSGVDAGDVYIRSDDTGSVSAPPHPAVRLGSSNPDNAGADTLANRDPDVTLRDGSITDREIATDVRTDPLYGDGRDGTINRTSNGQESGFLYAEEYSIESGVTRTVDGWVVIFSQSPVTIDGTLTAAGATNNGGAGGFSNGESGNNGGNGFLSPTGPGGSGGSISDGGDGGDGGDGDTGSPTYQQLLPGLGLALLEDEFRGGLPSMGAGGGGGGAGLENGASGESSEAGTAPGGGGEGGDAIQSGGSGSGGDGGDGGGLVAIFAPKITITGSVDADGQDGQNGGNADPSGGGGGGGGSGGAVLLVCNTLTNTGNISADAGTGGTGGSGANRDGADGAPGEPGIVVKKNLR